MEFIEREVALSFPFANGKYDHENANEHFIFGCEAYKEWLEMLPAVVVPVVRCKDCKHYREEPSKTRDDAVVVWCAADHYPANSVMPDDWFCAGGQRRE